MQNNTDRSFSTFYNKLNKILKKHAPMKTLSYGIGVTMENNNIANYVNIFACVRFKSLRSILIIAHYSNARSL